MFGMVGWSVAMPTMLGLFLGIQIDRRLGGAPGAGVSWTLTLLVLGVVAGCLNAWSWVAREGGLDGGDRAPREPREPDQDGGGDDHGRA
jgi:ATP synthase protein I